jgi:hypothetical protein
MADEFEPVVPRRKRVTVEIAENLDYSKNIIRDGVKFEMKLLVTSVTDKKIIFEQNGGLTFNDINKLEFQTSYNLINVYLDLWAYTENEKYHFSTVSENNPYLKLIETGDYDIEDYTYRYDLQDSSEILIEVIEEETFREIFTTDATITIEEAKNEIEILEGNLKKAQREIEVYKNSIKNFNITTRTLGPIDDTLKRIETSIYDSIRSINFNLTEEIIKDLGDKVEASKDGANLMNLLLQNKFIADSCIIAAGDISWSTRNVNLNWLRVSTLTDKRLSTLTHINYIIDSLKVIKNNLDAYPSQLSDLVLNTLSISGYVKNELDGVESNCTIKIINRDSKIDSEEIYTTTSSIDGSFTYTFPNELTESNRIYAYTIDSANNESEVIEVTMK